MRGIFRQLRWRIVVANMIVVGVGVAIVLLMAFLITTRIVPEAVETSLSALVEADASSLEEERLPHCWIRLDARF